MQNGVACIGNTNVAAAGAVVGVGVVVVVVPGLVGGDTRTACWAAVAGPGTSLSDVNTAVDLASANTDAPPNSIIASGVHVVASARAHLTLHRVCDMAAP